MTSRLAQIKLALLVAACVVLPACSGNSPSNDDGKVSDEQTQQLEKLVTEREELDSTIWSNEVLAQKHEDVFVKLWDDLRGAADKHTLLAEFSFDSLLLGEPQDERTLDWDVQVSQFGGEGRSLDPAEWKELVGQLTDDGLKVVETEWHHSSFEPGSPARSTVSMTLHLENEPRETRYVVKGNLGIEWASGDESSKPRVATIDTRNVRVTQRTGQPSFTQEYSAKSKIERCLLVYDVDRDGRSDVILPSENALLRNRGDWQFERLRFLKHHAGRTFQCGVLADFTGDGFADFLGGGVKAPLLLFAGDADGKFLSKPHEFEKSFEDPVVITAGDIDGDGDIDAFLGQYKKPYVGGQMPTPCFDANDGYPAMLLVNNGDGQFIDGTEAAGLAPKRLRRTYGACFIDIDQDHDLDLLVASDFAGLDFYYNDGKGHFEDATDRTVDQRHSFGMALTFGDYNLDEKTDFYMIGMSSTTARRLSKLGLGRDEFPEHQEKRGLMGYGNRMYLATGDKEGSPAFQQPEFRDQVARTGWSWGCTSFDFDNDADDDIYVANGHISQDTAKDYCTRFWCHDIYTGGSQESESVSALFTFVNNDEKSKMSWNGFEHNCLLMNEEGDAFTNIGYLMDVAHEQDSRCVVSDDFDLDGRPDLLVLTLDRTADQRVIRLLKNDFSQDHHWIGVRLQEEGPHHSPMGATVTVRTADRRQVKVVLSGDSSFCQHATLAHFGLAAESQVDELVVRWANGTEQRVASPAIDQYHLVRPSSPEN